MSNAPCMGSGWNFNRNSNGRLKYLFTFHEIVPFHETDKVGITLRSVRVTLCAGKKQLSVTYSECVSILPLVTRPAYRIFSAPYFIVISGLFASTAFYTLYHKRHYIQETFTEYWNVFWFPLQLLPETFLVLRIIQEDSIINVPRSSCKLPAIHLKF